jgi:OFA family oxalate/formate antiporter-like MFS transporter
MREKNRWLIALSAVGMHLSIGSVYSWSIFSKPLMSSIGWSLQEVSFTFSLAIVFLGLSAALMGKWVEKNGPRKSGLIAAMFFTGGLFLSAVAIYFKNLELLYFAYGVLGGTGLGIGYITPVSTLVKWFPDKKGLATGLAIMGFGFASFIASPIIANLIVNVGLVKTFLILGITYLPIMLLSANYICPPPKDYISHSSKANQKIGQTQYFKPLDTKEALRTRRFYLLWLMLFINITGGIAIISIASPMAQEIAGLTPLAAASMVGIMGLFNGGGRIGWATLSDHIGRPNTYIFFFTFQIIAFALLPHITNPLFFQILLFSILTCYGGGFACIPAYLSDFFGTKELSAIHGRLLTAWATAGLVGPMIASSIRETTNSYSRTLEIFAGFFVIALIVAILAKLEMWEAQQHHSTKHHHKGIFDRLLHHS